MQKQPMGQFQPGSSVAASVMGKSLNRGITIIPGDKNKAQRGVFMTELHDLLTKFDRTIVEELSDWLKINQDALPDAVYEKLEAQVSLHVRKAQDGVDPPQSQEDLPKS